MPKHLFQDSNFRQLWAEYMAGRPSVLSMEKAANRWFYTEKQPMLKGLFSLRCLKTPGWYGWAEEFDQGCDQQFLQYAKSADWHYAILYLMDSPANTAFSEELTQEGYELHTLSEETELWAEMPEGWENYIKKQNSSQRKIIRNKMRRLENMDFEIRLYESDTEFNAFFDQFFKYHSIYWKEKQGYAPYEDDREKAFFLAWCQSLRAAGNLRLLGFYLEGELVTLAVNMICDDALYFMVTANTGAKQESGAGVLIQLHEMKVMAEQGIKRFYFGPGDYLHKRQASNVATPTRWVLIANPRSWVGRQAVAFRMKKQAKPVAVDSPAKPEENATLPQTPTPVPA